MNKLILASLTSLVIAAPALANKPDTAGQGKAEREHMEARQDMHKTSPKKHVQPKAEPYRLSEEEKRHFEAKKQKAEAEKAQSKGPTGKDKQTGEDKQRDKKAEQMRKELGKGSEQGQAARAENSKKWWKFW